MLFRNVPIMVKMVGSFLLVATVALIAGRIGPVWYAPAALITFVVSWAVARSIVRPVIDLQRAASGDIKQAAEILMNGLDALAKEDLTVAYKIGSLKEPTLALRSTDELGQATDAVRQLISLVARCLRGYETARAGSQALIARVTEAAQQVDSGTVQLATATNQIGQASTQIAKAIEDVARGASDQSRIAVGMTQEMAGLSEAISEVLDGVERQIAHRCQSHHAGALPR